MNVNIINSSSAIIYWNPPVADQQNGFITYYLVTINNHESGHISVINATDLSLNLNDLHPFYTYDCYVAAVTVENGPVALITFEMPENGKKVTLIIIFCYFIYI